MIKINYKKPEELETPEDIAIANIKICDKYKKADYLELSCISWLKIDSKRNYQDLEQLFRQLELDSYVIAQTIDNIPDGLKIGLPNEKTLTANIEMANTETVNSKLEYIAKITCIGREESMKELLKYHTTLEENYECLEKTGCLMALKQEKFKEEEEQIAQTKGVEEVQKILECTLKLDLEYYSVCESIDFIIGDLTNQYGKKPEKIICGEISTNKVWALMIDNQIVSPIGWMEKIINQEDKQEENNEISSQTNTNLIDYELIDFRKIKMEK